MRFHKSGSDRESGIRPARLIAIGVIFFAVAFVYFVQMVLLRVWGSESGLYSIYDGGNTKTTLTVEAVRGDIYDRNGVLLVTSETAYQMAFTYDAIPDTSQDFNLSIAKTAKALKENAVERTEVQFPLYGTYPDYGYYAEALDENSEYRTGLLTVLDALGLEQDASCEALVDAMATRYRFKRTDLSDEELDAVFRIRYDMLRCGFGVYTPYVIAEDASEDLMTYIEELDIRGVVFVPKTERVYKFPGYASHILGELGKIPEGALDDYVAQGYAMDATVGVSGCEAAYESVLRGIDGKLVREYDKEGVLIDSHYEKEPVAGNDVYLTIDIEVQIAAEDALKENIENIASAGGELTGGDADAGAVVAIDPKDFSILALASYPTYDLSTYGLTYGDLITDEMKPLLNRALNGTYEPGSTFKVGMALAALEEGIVTPETKINDTGIYTYYPGYQPRCWVYTETGHGHGPIAVAEALQVSCNYFFYDVGRILGIDRITSYMSRLGLGKTTGIELPEQLGILASPAYRDENGETPWTSGDTLQASIGQSNNLFTPLQMACYFATVFNGGTRYDAHLLSSVKEFYTGKTLSEHTPTVESELKFSDETYETLLKGINDVITGNATLSRYFRDLKAAGVNVGGKTGTAQVSSMTSDNAVFAAYAEHEGRELVSVCVIEHGSSGSYAGYTVSELMERYFGVTEE